MQSGVLLAQYDYDTLGRLVREDNKSFNKSYFYTYDNNGNILAKESCAFITGAHTVGTGDVTSYTYSKDKMIKFGTQSCVYDAVGNPTTYRGKTATWERGRKLASFDGTTFTYDALGRRLSKNDIKFWYDSNGRLLKQSNGLEFFYDSNGLVGLKYNGSNYVYRTDIQGNVIAILDSSGEVVVQYKYDAWGNQQVLDATGNAITDTTNIGILNPFRYRSYYFDNETGLYYLQTRYYDPEVGRFLNIDKLCNADSGAINGLNLWAYCCNNPVMGYDPYGTWDWGRFWKGFAIVAVAVAAVALTVATLGTGSAVGGVIVAGTVGAAGDMFSQAVIEDKDFSEINYGQVAISGVTSALSAIPGVGYTGSIGLSFAGGMLSARSDGADWEEAAINGIKSAGITAIAGGFTRSIGLGKMSKINNGKYANKKIFLDNVHSKKMANKLSSYSPAINKSTGFFRYMYEQVGLGGISRIANDTAGVKANFIVDVITSIIP